MVDFTVEEYERFVSDTMTNKPRTPEDYIHWATDELAAEVGELKGVLAKARRKTGILMVEDYSKMHDELGDCLWSLVACLQTISPDITLKELMIYNRNKLQARLDKGVVYRK